MVLCCRGDCCGSTGYSVGWVGWWHGAAAMVGGDGHGDVCGDRRQADWVVSKLPVRERERECVCERETVRERERERERERVRERARERERVRALRKRKKEGRERLRWCVCVCVCIYKCPCMCAHMTHTVYVHLHPFSPFLSLSTNSTSYVVVYYGVRYCCQWSQEFTLFPSLWQISAHACIYVHMHVYTCTCTCGDFPFI